MASNSDQEARVFPVDTRFQKLARRPGGVPRDEALRQAGGKLEEAEGSFDDWLESELRQLVDAIQHIERGNADRDSVEAASFHCYQLRNVGSTMRCELITFVAGSLCDVFDAIIAGASCDIDSIRCHLDSLLLAKQKAYRHLKPEQVPELTAGLRRVAAQVSASSAPQTG